MIGVLPPPARASRHGAPQDAPPPAVGELYDAHARALLTLASLLLDDGREAAAVVVHVLREAGRRRRAVGDRDDLRHLARGVYLRATRSRLGPAFGPHDLPEGGSRTWPGDHGLSALSDQQRAVIALSLHGGHSRADTAALLSLPTGVIDELLRSGLHRIRDGAG